MNCRLIKSESLKNVMFSKKINKISTYVENDTMPYRRYTTALHCKYWKYINSPQHGIQEGTGMLCPDKNPPFHF